MSKLDDFCTLLAINGVNADINYNGINPQVKIETEDGFYSIIEPFDYHDNTLELAFVPDSNVVINSYDNNIIQDGIGSDIGIILTHAEPPQVIDKLKEIGAF